MSINLSALLGDANDVVERVRRSTVSIQSHRGGGTGTVWSGGYVVTNNHVLPRGSDRAQVEAWDGTQFEADVLSRDQERDEENPWLTKPTIIVGNKADIPGSLDQYQELEAAFNDLYPVVMVSAEEEVGLDELAEEIFKALKVILDNLGEFQDLEVQAHSLEKFGEQMLKEGAPVSALMAMGILVGKLFERQQQARSEFVDLFIEFSGESNRVAFQQLFGVR